MYNKTAKECDKQRREGHNPPPTFVSFPSSIRTTLIIVQDSECRSRFYETYYNQAQEHDKESVKKYDDDLNTTLIFVSLCFAPPTTPMLIRCTGRSLLGRCVRIHREHPAGVTTQLRTADRRNIEDSRPFGQRSLPRRDSRTPTVPWPISSNRAGTEYPVFESRSRVILCIPRHARKAVVEQIFGRLYR